MSLPQPNYTFTIPSVHDDLELDCRLYFPRTSEQNQGLFGKAYAIFAHPYASLGGSFDDPVVGLVGGCLLRQGCVLITFNFRGASGSAGKTSWSAKPELGDYVSVYGFALCYIAAIYRLQDNIGVAQGDNKPILVLGGYSYGSMIASHLPAMDTVLELFKSPPHDSAENEIRTRADDLARDARAYLDMHSGATLSFNRGAEKSNRGVVVGGYDSDAASRRVSRESSRRSVDGERVKRSIDKVRRRISHRVVSPPELDAKPASATAVFTTLPRLAYVLISPLLPPTAAFATMFSKLRFTAKTLELNAPRSRELEELTLHPCICIYGSRDVFTSDRKLQRWVEELRSRPSSQFTALRTGAGHFWHEAEDIVQLQKGLNEWLKRLSPKTDVETSKTGVRAAQYDAGREESGVKRKELAK